MPIKDNTTMVKNRWTLDLLVRLQKVLLVIWRYLVEFLFILLRREEDKGAYPVKLPLW